MAMSADPPLQAAPMHGAPINVAEWLHENRHQFVPPISNLFLHVTGQLSVMYVAGPNDRQDYHVQRGEELFYQEKGDMVLKVVVKGRRKDVRIREGDIFILPHGVPHSPQRFANTMGLVLERRRSQKEIDILRFYTAAADDKDLSVLHERYFHWNDVQSFMPHCIKEFKNSEEYKTGTPKQHYQPPFEDNSISDISTPFNLHQWIQDNAPIIDQKGFLFLFDPSIYKHKVLAYGLTSTTYSNHHAQTWFYQHKGRSGILMDGRSLLLAEKDSVLLEIGKSCRIKQTIGNYLLSFSQEP